MNETMLGNYSTETLNQLANDLEVYENTEEVYLPDKADTADVSSYNTLPDGGREMILEHEKHRIVLVKRADGDTSHTVEPSH